MLQDSTFGRTIMNLIHDGLVKEFEQKGVDSRVRKVLLSQDADAPKMLGAVAIGSLTHPTSFACENNPIVESLLDEIFDAINWDDMLSWLRDEYITYGGNCECGEPLPHVMQNETPYQWCSAKCACAASNRA